MNVQFFLPFRKFDEATRRVYGVASVEEPDNANEIMDYATTKPLVIAWSQRLAKASGGKNLGNVRAMHGEVAAGHVVELECDDLTKSFPVCVQITDDNEWRKCQNGTYTGFSFGGRYVKKWPDAVLTKCKRYTADPRELSLADVPCVRGALITMVKSDGTEVQIEAHGQVQQTWSCGTTEHEHFRKADAQECFELAKTGKVLSSKNATAAQGVAVNLKAATGAVADALEALESILESAGLSEATVEQIMTAADDEEDIAEKILKFRKINENHDEKGKFAPADSNKETHDLLQHDAIMHDNLASAARARGFHDKADRHSALASMSRDIANTHYPLKKISGADDDLGKTTPRGGDPSSREVEGEEMDAKEKEELIKTLSASTADELKKILGGEDLKKTLGEVVTTIVTAEMAKSDAKFVAIQSDLDTLGETFAKVMGIDTPVEPAEGESMAKTFGDRLAKLLAEPDDSKAPLKKMSKDDEARVDDDKLAKNVTAGDLFKESLRNPVSMFRLTPD